MKNTLCFILFFIFNPLMASESVDCNKKSIQYDYFRKLFLNGKPEIEITQNENLLTIKTAPAIKECIGTVEFNLKINEDGNQIHVPTKREKLERCLMKHLSEKSSSDEEVERERIVHEIKVPREVNDSSKWEMVFYSPEEDKCPNKINISNKKTVVYEQDSEIVQTICKSDDYLEISKEMRKHGRENQPILHEARNRVIKADMKKAMSDLAEGIKPDKKLFKHFQKFILVPALREIERLESKGMDHSENIAEIEDWMECGNEEENLCLGQRQMALMLENGFYDEIYEFHSIRNQITNYSKLEDTDKPTLSELKSLIRLERGQFASSMKEFRRSQKDGYAEESEKEIELLKNVLRDRTQAYALAKNEEIELSQKRCAKMLNPQSCLRPHEEEFKRLDEELNRMNKKTYEKIKTLEANIKTYAQTPNYKKLLNGEIKVETISDKELLASVKDVNREPASATTQLKRPAFNYGHRQVNPYSQHSSSLMPGTF